MTHCFRLHRGQDLYEEIEHYARAHHIAAGVVLSGVGCLVNTTAEIVLLELEGTAFSREPDPATGYDELVIRNL